MLLNNFVDAIILEENVGVALLYSRFGVYIRVFRHWAYSTVKRLQWMSSITFEFNAPNPIAYYTTSILRWAVRCIKLYISKDRFIIIYLYHYISNLMFNSNIILYTYTNGCIHFFPKTLLTYYWLLPTLYKDDCYFIIIIILWVNTVIS